MNYYLFFDDPVVKRTVWALRGDGKLLICQHGNRIVAVMNSTLFNPIPNYSVLEDKLDGKKINSPDDLTVNSNGDFYFTDPRYGLPGLDRDSAKEIPFNGVYKISKGKVFLLIDTLTKPNGIAFFPNNKTLIVANSYAQKPIWYAFDIDDPIQFIMPEFLYCYQ